LAAPRPTRWVARRVNRKAVSQSPRSRPTNRMNDPSDFPPAMLPARAPEPPRLAADDFISRDALGALVAAGEVRVQGALARTSGGGLYVLREAARVLGNISHETDPYGFTGQVDSVGGFLRRGFVMSGERMAL